MVVLGDMNRRQPAPTENPRVGGSIRSQATKAAHLVSLSTRPQRCRPVLASCVGVLNGLRLSRHRTGFRALETAPPSQPRSLRGPTPPDRTTHDGSINDHFETPTPVGGQETRVPVGEGVAGPAVPVHDRERLLLPRRVT